MKILHGIKPEGSYVLEGRSSAAAEDIARRITADPG